MKLAPWKTIQTNGCLRKKSVTTESKENRSKQRRNGRLSVTEEAIVGLTVSKNAILITRPRQISIVEDTDESVLHSSKPGKATSFSIPAVRCDPSMIFALQNGNQQLVCFKNNKTTLSMRLESPAIQLAALPGSAVFGTCKNGRIFVASVASVSTLKVHYFGEESTTKRPMSLAFPLSDSHRPTNRKRGGQDLFRRSGICFLQQSTDVVELVSYTWDDILSDDNVEIERKKLPRVIPSDLKGVVFLGALDNNVVCARYGDAIFSFSTCSGRLAYRALTLPPKLVSICLAGGSNVACITDDNELLVIDVRRDMIVARQIIDDATKGKAHTLLTDGAKDRLYVISEVSNNMSSVASTVLTTEDDQPMVTLASTLESAMALAPIRKRKRSEHQGVITDAICEFESACETILAGTAPAKRKKYLIESFSSMLEQVKRIGENGAASMKNGTHHHVNGLNGHGNGNKKEVAIHPQVVGPSVRVLMRLLSHSSAPQNDCRFILRRLIRSGYTSARNDLAFPDLFHHTDTKSNGVSDKSCYLPLELIYDVLDHCTDVSERILVLSLKFLMSRMSDEDIMSFFKKSKRISSGTTKLDEHPARLRAMIDLFAKILDYSSCNDGILRNSMASLLTYREISLLIKMLIQFRRPSIGNAPGFRLTPNYMVWLTCLVDVVHDTDRGGEHLRDIVRRWTDDELFSKETLLALIVTVQQRLSVCKTCSDVQTESKESSSSAVAGYQIERVQF